VELSTKCNLLILIITFDAPLTLGLLAIVFVVPDTIGSIKFVELNAVSSDLIKVLSLL
jgi:hypothetical protein